MILWPTIQLHSHHHILVWMVRTQIFFPLKRSTSLSSPNFFPLKMSTSLEVTHLSLIWSGEHIMQANPSLHLGISGVHPTLTVLKIIGLSGLLPSLKDLKMMQAAAVGPKAHVSGYRDGGVFLTTIAWHLQLLWQCLPPPVATLTPRFSACSPSTLRSAACSPLGNSFPGSALLLVLSPLSISLNPSSSQRSL